MSMISKHPLKRKPLRKRRFKMNISLEGDASREKTPFVNNHPHKVRYGSLSLEITKTIITVQEEDQQA